jgi:hypothetical protein
VGWAADWIIPVTKYPGFSNRPGVGKLAGYYSGFIRRPIARAELVIARTNILLRNGAALNPSCLSLPRYREAVGSMRIPECTSSQHLGRAAGPSAAKKELHLLVRSALLV